MKKKPASTQSDILIDRIRAEVRVRKGISVSSESSDSQAYSSGKHQLPFLQRVEMVLERVKTKIDKVRSWPKFLRSVRLNQLAVNDGLMDALKNLVREAERIEENMGSLQRTLDERVGKQALVMDRHEAKIQELREENNRQKENLHLIESFIRSNTPGTPGSEEKPRLPLADQIHEARVDSFYVAFENQFRGSSEQIKERLQRYLPQLAAIKEKLPSARAVDVGCGRGEWLEILRENGIEGHGVDMNAARVEKCQSLGLHADCGDAIAYLQSLPSNSQAVISGFHIIEHLAVSELLELFRQSWRVLSPGGIAIFETPNPESQKVATYTFFFDPSHRNPIPPELLCFMATHAGFSKTHVERLQPFTQDEILWGYLDYAGIFTK